MGIVVLATLNAAASIHAEEQPGKSSGPALEEIIVTARKKEESLQKTPVSITVLNSGEIESRSMSDLSEIGKFTPNMSFTNSSIAGPSSGQVYIRGIGQYDFSIATDPGVGMYVDGVYLGRSVGGILDLVDLDRVEVLRGPQGSLYGKNTIGGAINIVSVKPSGDFGGDFKLTTGRFDRIDAQGSLDFPLVDDQLAGRISISSRNSDGYGERPLASQNKQMGNIDSQSARVLLNWKASSSLSVLLSLDDTYQRSGGPVRSLIATEQTPLMQLYNTFSGPYDDRYLTGNPFVSLGTDRQESDLDVWGASVTVEQKFDNLSLKSITAFRHTKSIFGVDADHSPLPVLDEFDVMQQHQISQEFQLSGTALENRLSWIGGAYYLKEKADMLFDLTIMSELFPILGLGLSADVGNKIDTDSYAVFGHGSFDLTDKLSASGGVRYTYENKDFAVFNRTKDLGLYAVPPTSMRDDWKSFSPKGGLEYKVGRDLMLYGSVARGFKSGGFNPRPSGPADLAPYDPEYVWTYETGLKSEWLDERLRVNASVFYNDYTDIQVTVISATPGGSIRSFIENAAKADVKGAELELAARPMEALDLSAGAGYTAAKYTQVQPGSTTTLGTQFIETPKWSLNLSGQYGIGLANVGSLTPRVDYVYQSKVYRDPANTPQLAQNGFGLIDARITFKPRAGKWQAAVFGTNLANKVYLSGAGASVLQSVGLVEGQFGRPREWGLTFKTDF